MKRPLLLICILWSVGSSYCFGQAGQASELLIYFRSGMSAIEPGYMNNSRSLSDATALFGADNIPQIDSIWIEGYSSPEGSFMINRRLSWDRALSVKQYLLRHYPAIAPSRIEILGRDINWHELHRLVEADMETPRRESILHIIDNVPVEINYTTNTSRKKSLMDLGGPTWNYLLRNHFPALRAGVCVTVVLKEEPSKDAVQASGRAATDNENMPDISEAAAEAAESATLPTATGQTDPSPAVDTAAVGQTDTAIPGLRAAADAGDTADRMKKPLFAVKTNLLFDAASLLNVEIEIPIGKRWSVAGEWIFPWWLWEKKQYCLQTLSGNIEGRYWFGNREKRPQLTGWFAGLYAGGGYYDLEFGDKGYQGEFFIAAGVSGGYAHTINRSGSLRMEYSLGVGYMKTDYREYIPKFGVDEHWHLIRQQNGTYSWFGPTRAKISLVWMINHKTKGGAK